MALSACFLARPTCRAGHKSRAFKPRASVDFGPAIATFKWQSLCVHFAKQTWRKPKMKKLVIKASLVLLVAALAVPAMTFAADAGADLFAGKCAMCHGKAGDATGPMAEKFDLKPLSSAEVQKLTDAELTTTIEKGKGKMTGFSGKLTAAQVKDLVKYIRTLKK